MTPLEARKEIASYVTDRFFLLKIGFIPGRAVRLLQLFEGANIVLGEAGKKLLKLTNDINRIFWASIAGLALSCVGLAIEKNNIFRFGALFFGTIAFLASTHFFFTYFEWEKYKKSHPNLG